MAWQADGLQSILFPVPSGSQLDALDVWKLITNGGAPEAYQSPNASPISVSFAYGLLSGLRLVVQSSLGRLDLTVQPHAPPDFPDPPRIAHLGAGFELLGRSVEIALKRTPVVRFGLIANLTDILSSDAEVSTKLSEECDGIWFPTPPLDCVYQVNVRRNYLVAPECEMNRVLTWSSGTYQMATTQMNPSSPTFPFVQIHRQLPMVSFKIDLNSATSTTMQHALEMYQETNDEMQEVIRSGIRRLS